MKKTFEITAVRKLTIDTIVDVDGAYDENKLGVSDEVRDTQIEFERSIKYKENLLVDDIKWNEVKCYNYEEVKFVDEYEDEETFIKYTIYHFKHSVDIKLTVGTFVADVKDDNIESQAIAFIKKHMAVPMAFEANNDNDIELIDDIIQFVSIEQIEDAIELY